MFLQLTKCTVPIQIIAGNKDYILSSSQKLKFYIMNRCATAGSSTTFYTLLMDNISESSTLFPQLLLLMDNVTLPLLQAKVCHLGCVVSVLKLNPFVNSLPPLYPVTFNMIPS